MESANGSPITARQALDAVQQAVENLEVEVARQRDEIAGLRKERDDYRKMLVEQIKHLVPQYSDEDFDPKDFTLTIDDLVAMINSK